MNINWKNKLGSLLLGVVLSMPVAAKNLSPDWVKKLNDTQQALEKKDYRRAQALLGDEPPLRQLDQAWWWRMRGVLAQSQGQQKQALVFFQTAASLNQFDAEPTRQLQQLVGDLALNQGKYTQAIRAYRAANAIHPTYSAWRGLAFSHYMQRHYIATIEAANKAIGYQAEPEKNLFEVQLAAQYEIGDWAGVVMTTQTLLARYPAQRDWYLQQAHGWQQQGQLKQAAASLSVAREQKLLNDASDWSWLAYLQQQIGAPLRAAETLVAGIEQGIVPNNGQSQRRLLVYYQLAKAWTHAEGPLAWLIAEYGLANDHRLLVEMRLTARDWQGAIAAARMAEQAGIKLRESLWLNLGFAASEVADQAALRWAYQNVLRLNPQSKIAQQQLAQLDG